MSLSSTPHSSRTHIAFFGKRNAGKSSLINAVTGQNISIVSAEKGTTTDPVRKTMELLPLGPVVITDTAGIDDKGNLGQLRVKKTLEVLDSCHIAVLVIDSAEGFSDIDLEIEEKIKSKNIPYITCYNKADLKTPLLKNNNEIAVSSLTGEGINELKNKLAAFSAEEKFSPLHGLISLGDTVVLVTPIDAAAPKGRLILPQQMVIRDILDHGAIAVTTQPKQLKNTFENLKISPKLVVCDSQVFKETADILPESIPLTSFSVLMLRMKLGINSAKEASKALDNIKDGDKILISEGCTHHRQCGDIGTQKLPAWIKKYTGKAPEFEFTSGGEFPCDLSSYSMVIHCGACMLTDKVLKNRFESAKNQGVPFTNFGIIISKTQGILDRALEVFDSKQGENV